MVRIYFFFTKFKEIICKNHCEFSSLRHPSCRSAYNFFGINRDIPSAEEDEGIVYRTFGGRTVSVRTLGMALYPKGGDGGSRIIRILL